METKLQSKKSKEQPPSNPFVGVFSRSKSQIYVHQNRSGRARIDTVPKQLHHQILIPPTPSRKRKAIKDPEAANPQIVSRNPVKDLRARRVFSPGASIGENCSPDGGNGTPKSKADCDVKGSDSLEMNCSPTNSGAEKCVKEGNLVIDLSPSGREVVVGSDCRSNDPEVTNPNLAVVEGEAQKNHNEKDVSPMAKEDEQRKTSVSIAPKLDETFKGNVNGINNEGLGSQANHKSKWVVSSCIRQRVFKSPGSFSYRRMLPFLQDISADDSGVSNTEKPSLGDSSNAQSLDKTNIKAPDVVSNGVDEMGEGDVQTTPPDWDSIFRAEVKGNRRNGNGTGMQTQDIVSRTPLKGIIKRNDRFMPEGYPRPANLKTEYSPMSKSVLTPCSSRIKKLKTVSSFSYRRLLPYLMESRNRDSDISNDTSRCAQPIKAEEASENKIPGPALGLRFGNIPNGTSKTACSSELETACETALLTTDLALASDEKIQSFVLSESLKECTSPVEKVESVLKDLSSNLDESCVDTVCETPTEHDKLKPATSLKDSTLLDDKIAEDGKIIEAFNLAEDAEISQVDEVIQKIYRSMELEPAPLTLALGTTADIESPSKNSPSRSKNSPSRSKNSPSSSKNSPSPSKNTPSPSKNTPSPSKITPSPSKNSPSLSNISGDISLVSQEDKDGKTSELVVSSDETLSLLKDAVPSGNVADGRARGILRRNPRGCRGLCDCLSCSSFRLHADKAFEFSKNQFLDAEEVAAELIKEMSHLRDMLEKCTSDGNGHASLCVSQEVKDACLKASKAEELAKDRLSEMNSELTIHCRTMQLQRPKVRFANHVQETIIHKISDKNKIGDRR